MPATLDRRPAWIFDRADRLSDLAARARALAEALRRRRCDALNLDADPATTASFMARAAAHDARGRRLAALGAGLRRKQRFAAV